MRRTKTPAVIPTHSNLNKDLIKSQLPLMGPSQGEKALSGGPEFGFRKILASGAGQKNIKT